MDTFSSIEELNQSLIKQYLQGSRNKEFEESMMITLFTDQDYKTIFSCLKQGFILTKEIENEIVASGDVELYQYLFGLKKLKLTKELMNTVVKIGKLETVEWLFSVKCSRDIWTCTHAAENGHLKVLQLCRIKGCYCDKWTCVGAAKNGHLEVLKWLHENGCPWDEYTCDQAATKGHLEVLQWCRAHGCPWYRDECFRLAKQNNHQHIIDWIESLD